MEVVKLILKITAGISMFMGSCLIMESMGLTGAAIAFFAWGFFILLDDKA